MERKTFQFCNDCWNVSCVGDKVIEIGANWIHGPSEENPVFCLARHYGLLDPEALTQENQAFDLGGETPWITNIFSSSGSQHSESHTAHLLDLLC